jgi:hypothetical protein
MKSKKTKTSSRSKKLTRGKALKSVKPLSVNLNPQPLPPIKLPPGLSSI